MIPLNVGAYVPLQGVIGIDTLARVFLNSLGLTMGIALLALGLTLIFGILDIVQFAHAEFFMLSAYGTIVAVAIVGNYWVALLIASIVVALFGMLLEKLTLEPVRERDPLQSLIITFGLILVIQQSVLTIFGGAPRSMPTPIEGSMQIWGFTYPWTRMVLIIGGAAVIAATILWLRYSRIGLLIRASAQDIDTARTLGVPAPKIYSITFGVGTFLAAIAAGLLAPIRGVEPFMGIELILDAFIVVIIGGLGSIVGALIGSVIIGFTQGFSFLVLAPWHGQVLAFVFMIIVLLIKPEGIMG